MTVSDVSLTTSIRHQIIDSIRPRYPHQRPGDLSESQIEWLKANIPAFNRSKEAADKVRAEVEANRRLMGG